MTASAEIQGPAKRNTACHGSSDGSAQDEKNVAGVGTLLPWPSLRKNHPTEASTQRPSPPNSRLNPKKGTPNAQEFRKQSSLLRRHRGAYGMKRGGPGHAAHARQVAHLHEPSDPVGYVKRSDAGRFLRQPRGSRRREQSGGCERWDCRHQSNAESRLHVQPPSGGSRRPSPGMIKQAQENNRRNP